MSTTVTLTPVDAAGGRAPHVDVLVTSIDAGVSTVTVWRTVGDRSFKVRGLVGVSASGSVTIRDFEAPFGESSYRVQQFDAGGDFVSYSSPVTVTLDAPADPNTAWVHDPLNPFSAVEVLMAGSAAGELVRPLETELFRVPGRTVSVAISRGRRGLAGVRLDCITRTVADEKSFGDLFGGYDSEASGIVCFRTQDAMRLPPTLFVSIAAPRGNRINARLGRADVLWTLEGDEVAPPAEALVTSDLGYADFTATYPSYTAFSAAYASYTEATRDYSIAGTA